MVLDADFNEIFCSFTEKYSTYCNPIRKSSIFAIAINLIAIKLTMVKLNPTGYEILR
jgi:hypothetical protein